MPTGQPYVNVHDFPFQAEGKAIPYGAYDVVHDRAVVNVGISHDTSEFPRAPLIFKGSDFAALNLHNGPKTGSVDRSEFRGNGHAKRKVDLQ
jgi:hypothetical protein